ncbi:MAG: hypothetical protein U0Q15_11310 [Kineosporiaceae bacterium]
MSLLVIMGSGETAPTMIKVHRAVLAAAGTTTPAVMLDTPFGFQMNADDLVERTQAYFRDAVGLEVEVAAWRRSDAPVVDRERSLALLRGARWAFAGPGSPSYALRQWQDTGVPEALADVAERGGTLVFGSAAACTLGTHAIPVYEIYKVGEDPAWLPALDLLGRLTGLRAVVVPHYDNAEGGKHDTRFCYLGEQRLARLEAELDPEIGVLGVDEHTALVVDLGARRCSVEGNGTVTVRRRGHSVVLPAGTQLDLSRLDALLRGVEGPGAEADGSGPDSPLQGPDADAVGTVSSREALPSLLRDADAAREQFDAALQRRDVDGCVAAALALDDAIDAWSADTDMNDDAEHARRLLRGMVVQLGELARGGARDPREVLGPLVDLVLALRAQARNDRDWSASDRLRDGLAGAGVAVRDTPEGQQWDLAAG